MKKIIGFIIAFLIVFGLIAENLYAEQCQDLTRLPDYNGKKIGLRNDTLLFSTSILKIDIDGSKFSYGVHDQGVEHICNGLSPITPERCQNAFQQGDCFENCVKQFKEWHKDGHDPAKLGNYMRSIGLGGANGSIPNVKLQPEPNNEMFVSHTSVRYGPWQKGQPIDSIEHQEAQLEPFEVPFFVIPSKFRSLPWDATPGDLGVAVHAQDPERYALFVVGDVGGNLDEGSAKLHELLRGEELIPQIKSNVFGIKVKRYGNLSLTKFSAGSDLDLRIAIFRHTSSYNRKKSGNRLILQDVHSQREMLRLLEKRGNELLSEFGGAEAIIACTNK